jgi:hypothetical protein
MKTQAARAELWAVSSVNRKVSIPGREDLPSVFTYDKGRAAGISAERLYAYRNQGLVIKSDRAFTGGTTLLQWRHAENDLLVRST